ncbi:hypothetical protein HFV04_021400 [Pseudomonas sp. BIGb0427]|uniref:hypothetical protein n=1 Tax=unclassified Pseudomonas TaxID=196821 RepID=UPI0018A72C6D|nr:MULTISPECIES: hypothetical protein [unclassified Pseudomonas]QPG62061.1 hypothetical protein HFV04_021400 [Pseudomonas sp. BIGb0427]UVM64416.1 hypothetical protein LOY34_13750 [Pseudomonas sp. B21-009]
MQQRYMLTIWGLFSKNGSDVCGAQAVIAIMDGAQEVDRMTIDGKCQTPSGYRRSYMGKSGLTAQLLSGPAGLSYVWGKDEVDPYRPVIAWRRRLSNPPSREPFEVDVQDGRAEYLLSGPYSIGEGGRIEVVDGKLLFTGSNFKIN